MKLTKIIKNGMAITVLVFIAVIAMNSGTAQALSKAGQHKLYKTTIAKYDKTVRKAAEEIKEDYDYSKGDTYYAFIDIDKDGVDECVLRYGGTPDTAKDSGYGETTSLYTIKDGKVKAVLENHKSFDPHWHMDYVRVFKNSSMIDLGFSHGDGDYFFYKYQNGKIDKKKGTRITFYTNAEGKKVAGIEENGKSKTVSVAKGKKKYKKLSGGGKGVKMRKYTKGSEIK